MNITRLKLPALRHFVESTAWAIHPERGAALLERLESRALGDHSAFATAVRTDAPPKGRAGAEARSGDRRPVTKSGGAIAVLPMYGVIAQRMDMMMAYCGGTSTEAFADAFDAAMADPNVSAIVIDCDSPGGNVQGTPELAKRILAARGKGKQIVAVVNGTMASAAYWICSAADEIVSTPSGEVGSIGVFCVHVDQSAMNEMVGLKYTLIKAGEHKAETNPWEPLADDARAFMQGQVDEMNGMFIAAIAKQRGTDSKTINDKFGQGRCFTAKQALGVGMIDRIATLQETLERLGARNVGASGRASQALGAQHITFDGMGQPLGARLAGSVDDGDVDDGDDDEADDRCPECDAPLDEDGSCSACGWKSRAGENASRATRNASADLADATEPKYAAGDRVVATVDHMAGMKGMAGAVHEANAGAPPYYSVDFDEPMGEGNPHKWLNEDEIEPEDANETSETMDDEMAHGSSTTKAILSPTAGAVGAALTPSPDQRPHAAKELPMDEQVKTALAAERTRAADIRALGRDHGIDEKRIDAMVDSGMSMEAVSGEILASIKARHAANPTIIVGADRAADRPFKSFGEQLVAVVQAGKPGGGRDARLDRVNAEAQRMVAGSPSGMNEGVGSEGGFFIQNDLLPEVTEPVYTDDPILSKVTRIPIGAGKNGVAYNVVDESARTDGSRWGGIRMVWGDEADSPAATKPKMRRVEHNLKKLIGLAYLTDELMEDAPAAQKLLTDAFQAESRFMLTSAIFRGTGGGQPLGFMKSKALQTIGIEAGETIANQSQSLGMNVTKMLAAVPAALWSEVLFLYNQELLPYLVTATIGAGGAAVPIFIGAGGLVNRPFDTILGRPAYASEQCEAVGTPGDILAVAPSQYHLADKGGPQQAMSLHVRFLYDEAVLRITQRLDGKPVWNQTVAPYKGATARSPFVVLGARA
jgi:HK97 family phage major capsid protein